MNQYQREEEQLERDYREVLISQAEYNKQLGDMQRDYRQEMRYMAEEAAERAYNDTLGEWS